MVKNLPANVGDGRDAGLIPGSGRSPGGGKGNPLQYSCPVLCRATIHGVTKSHFSILEFFDYLLISKISYQVVFSIWNLTGFVFSEYMYV